MYYKGLVCLANFFISFIKWDKINIKIKAILNLVKVLY